MSLVLVTFELKQTDNEYKDFWRILNEYNDTNPHPASSCVRLSPTCYMIDANEDKNTVFVRLKPRVYEGDQLCVINVRDVIELKYPFLFHGSEAIHDWLRRRLSSQ